ncbi:hypothetical protein DFJ63DRAFT_28469 [Scheffersomyces coipomensis]|uniref:uncharacterized protein n=1 Tax=Scheffersomyces coipomensis TaxID=1788519 RepID=UPI00315E01D3
MGRKLQGMLGNKKGLKGALARHSSYEAKKKQLAKSLEIQNDQKLQKEKQIKRGGNNNKQKQQQQQQQQQANQKGLIPFTKDNKVLLVGEGDFSFAVSIIEENLILPQNLLATSFDSLEELNQKYPNIEENLAVLKENGVKVLHSIDATDLVGSLKLIPNSKQKKSGTNHHNQLFTERGNLNYIMFNFPHTGRGMKDMDRNIRDHQKLVLEYIKSSIEVFKLVNSGITNDFGGYGESSDSNNQEGKIVLSLFEGEPYNSWNIKILARSHDYKVERSGKFDWTMFPQYHHRRTNSTRDTTKPAPERDARIYVFEKFKPKTKSKKGEDEDDSD